MENIKNKCPFFRDTSDECDTSDEYSWTKGCEYIFFESKTPLYLKDERYLEKLKNYPYFEINADNRCPSNESAYESLKEFILNNANAQIAFIIINTNDITQENQKKLSYMVKDRTWQITSFTDNCKVIVLGNTDEMNNQLHCLLLYV